MEASLDRGRTGPPALLRSAPARRAPALPRRTRVAHRMATIQQEIIAFFESFEPEQRFLEDSWERPGGGGGVARVLTDGETFEKVGVNWSQVFGPVPAPLQEHLDGAAELGPLGEFFATGVSVVAHPRSPMVPIVHLNVRFFELADPEGRPVDGWFGGGCDLTPTYPHPEDAASFHRGLRTLCRAHGPNLYREFKEACDGYFVNTHRDNEPRGVGGLFFDHLRSGDRGMDWSSIFGLVQDVGTSLTSVYGPIVARRRHESYGEEEREFQLRRRGRYVEFNLVHDRGTRFGLQTAARIESVLMSLPPMARWPYDPQPEPGSFEETFFEMLRPRDWADWTPPSS